MCVYTFIDTPTANQITVLSHYIVDWKYTLIIYSIRPIELEQWEKPKNLIRQDSYLCKVSKYAYDKFVNMHVTNLKISCFNSSFSILNFRQFPLNFHWLKVFTPIRGKILIYF